MPVIPKEGTGLDPSQLQQSGEAGKAGQDKSAKATTEDFKSKGPQIPSDGSLPPKASRAEAEERKKELNQ